MTPEEIHSLVDTKLEAELRPIKDKLDQIVNLLAKFEGAGTVMKLIFLGVAPVIAGLAWLKDHIKL
jgi:hypothetical protein